MVDPADCLREASESRTAVPLDTIGSLLRELSRDPPADMRLAAQLRVAADAASAPSAGPRVLAPAPGPNNVVPLRAVEQPVLKGRGGLVETASVVSGISLTGRIVDPADRPSQASAPGTVVTLGTIDSLLRDLSRDPPADSRLAGGAALRRRCRFRAVQRHRSVTTAEQCRARFRCGRIAARRGFGPRGARQAHRTAERRSARPPARAIGRDIGQDAQKQILPMNLLRTAATSPKGTKKCPR